MSSRKEYEFEKMRLSTRTRIMNAALVLFTTYGFDKTTTDKIAKRAGVSSGLLYNYFKSKNELIMEMVRQAIVMAERGLAKVSEIRDPSGFIKRSISGLGSLRSEENTLIPKLVQLLQAQPELYPEAIDLIKNFQIKVVDELAERLNEMGSANPTLEAKFIQAVVAGTRSLYFLLGSEYPLEEMIELIIKKSLPSN